MSSGPVLDAATLEELRRLAQSRLRWGRQSIAKASAIRALERLAREGRRQPIPPMPEGWYPHEPGDPFYELDWVFLHDHPEILQRHWETAWQRGASLSGPRLLLLQPRGLEGEPARDAR